MTELGEDYLGIKAERARRAKTSKSDESKQPRRLKQYAAKNDAGEISTFGSRAAALEWACPPDRVQEYEYGDKITL